MIKLCINPECRHPKNSDDRNRCQNCGAKLRLGDRFQPIQQLAQGGFGRTFLAWDEGQSPPQMCVIKQILPSQGSRDRDWQEAERLAQLGQHPQIPTLIAILDSPRDLCLVQDYIAGPTLEQVLVADGPWTGEQVRSLLLALLPVLQFIHDQGIIHRDIKPENILLQGRDRLPILVDFGAARTIPTATQLKQTGTVIGSAGYAAPEQALGKAVPASDLYSLGVTCLHLLTVQHPFDLYTVTDDDWVWQSYLPQPIRPTLSRVLTRLTTRSLRSRYASATAALADLDPTGMLTPIRARHCGTNRQDAPNRNSRNASPLPHLSPSSSLSPPLPHSPTWHCIQTWLTPQRIANAIAISPDGRAIATANRDASVQLWDRQTGDMLYTFARRLGFGDGHTDSVTAVQFHPDGQTLFSGSQDSTLKQWDLQTYRLLHTWQQASWLMTAIALHPDGQTVITAAANGSIQLWSLATATPQLNLLPHRDAVNAMALSPDGRRLVSVGAEGNLRLWAIPSGELLHTWTASGDRLLAVALSSDDPAIITGNATGQITVWPLGDLQQHFVLSCHQDSVTAIALSPDGRWLATGSRDREIHLWDWRGEAKHRVGVLRHDWAICDLRFMPNSRTLVSSSEDETIRFWQTEA